MGLKRFIIALLNVETASSEQTLHGKLPLPPVKARRMCVVCTYSHIKSCTCRGIFHRHQLLVVEVLPLCRVRMKSIMNRIDPSHACFPYLADYLSAAEYMNAGYASSFVPPPTNIHVHVRSMHYTQHYAYHSPIELV